MCIFTRARCKVLGLGYVKLGTSGHWVGNLTGAGVMPHYEYDKAFLVPAPWVSAAAYMQSEKFLA